MLATDCNGVSQPGILVPLLRTKELASAAMSTEGLSEGKKCQYDQIKRSFYLAE